MYIICTEFHNALIPCQFQDDHAEFGYRLICLIWVDERSERGPCRNVQAGGFICANRETSSSSTLYLESAIAAGAER